MSSLGLISKVENADIRARAIEQAKVHNVLLPTFTQLAEPWTAPQDIRQKLRDIDPDAADPANLFRMNWYNDATGVSIRC